MEEDGGGYGWWEDPGGGSDLGSAMSVTPRQMAQRIDWAPGGSCNGVWQLEQFTSINIAVVVRLVCFGCEFGDLRKRFR